ncbi:uncharacterized protein LOC122274362 [Carya illinoinensis]|uniref:uncharacterized protein LOC122274362 n=1 Tax=Carya illinoinensis TaxID=32201 RepID=UPI001C7242E0|nr:uncharacterized protein LOC122274362 [Carya illinoinensis]
MVKDKSPSMIFLMEIKCTKTRIEEVKGSLSFDACISVESRGSSGGLALMWKKNIEVSIYNYSRWHISASISSQTGSLPWFFTGFYGHPETSKRKCSWELLKDLKPLPNTPWLVCGDFNEITCQDEKMGGPPRPYNQMEKFREALDFCSLKMILTRFKEACCVVSPAVKSDHLPLHIALSSKRHQGSSLSKLFRFEAAWTLKEGCAATIKKAWGRQGWGEDQVPLVVRRLRNCSTELKKWDTNENRGAPAEVKQKMSTLCKLQEEGQGEHVDLMLRLQNEIEQSLEEEDLKWKQRAKQHWLKMGIGECIKDVPLRITGEMNEHLGREFTAEEVKMVVFHMNGLGSPGPDGFSALFYQTNWNNWNIVGKEVTRFALNILNKDGSLEGSNDIFIKLIPKIKEAKRVSDFRPISLCNVLYKIVAKVVANKLKVVLPNIISQSQSTFSPGRAITDNILVAYETLHSMTTKMQGKSGYMAFKLNMSKAYDRVE